MFFTTQLFANKDNVKIFSKRQSVPARYYLVSNWILWIICCAWWQKELRMKMKKGNTWNEIMKNIWNHADLMITDWSYKEDEMLGASRYMWDTPHLYVGHCTLYTLHFTDGQERTLSYLGSGGGGAPRPPLSFLTLASASRQESVGI